MINRIKAKNYRSLKAVDIQPGRVNVIIGPAGSGKTSIVEAIRYLLTGRNQWTADNGSGIQTQVAVGSKKSELGIEWIHPTTGEVHKFDRTIPAPAGVKALQAKIDEALGASSDLVAAQLATRRFLGLPEKQQRDLLAQILTPDVTVDRLIEEMDRWGDDQPGLGKWFDGHIEQAPQNKTLFEFAEMERRAQKKVRDDIQQQIRVKGEAPEPQNVTQASLDALLRRVQEVSEQLSAADTRQDGAEDVWRAEHQAWEGRRKAIEEAQAAALKAEERLATITDHWPKPPARASKQIESDGKNVAEAIAAVEARVKANADAAADATASGGACPAGVCARAKLEESQRTASALEAELKPLRQRREEILKDFYAAREAETKVAQADADLAAAEKAHEDALARVSALPLPGDEPERPAVNTGNLDQLLRDKDEALRALKSANTARSAFEAWERTQKDLTDLRERLVREEAEVQRWEAAFVALGPTGIRARLMQQRVQELITEADGKLREYFGAALRLTEEPWELQVDIGERGGWIPAGQISWSWQARLSLCLQVAIAHRSGFPVVVLDETGADPQVRMDLLALLDDEPGIQSFILSTAQLMAPTGEFLRPDVDPEDEAAGVRFFWVEGGVEQLQPVAVAVPA